MSQFCMWVDRCTYLLLYLWLSFLTARYFDTIKVQQKKKRQPLTDAGLDKR